MIKLAFRAAHRDLGSGKLMGSIVASAPLSREDKFVGSLMIIMRVQWAPVPWHGGEGRAPEHVEVVT